MCRCEKIASFVLDLLSKRLLPFHEGQYLRTIFKVSTFTLHNGKKTARASLTKASVVPHCIISHTDKTKINKHVFFFTYIPCILTLFFFLFTN
jgi:hypothetical protein